MSDTRTATFLFTDMEGSTRLLERLGDEYAELLGQHWQLLREAAVAGGGEEFGAEGDAMFFAFGSASEAARAAVAAQVALRDHPWPDGVGVKVRMALHTGPARVVFGSWVGLALHHAARICAAGHGGQVLVSPVTARLLASERPQGIRVESLGEYLLRDITEAQELGQLEHADLAHDFPPLRTPAAAVTNLPNALTTFIGRQAEIGEVRLLVERHRLVTLTGGGGTGKTRLAYEAAGDVGPAFEGGVWVAELAAVRDEAGVGRAVASAVGTGLDPAQPLAPQLAGAVRDCHLLLVLDNCEHLVEPVAVLVDHLLRACARLSVLATSRESLRVPGELVWPVPPMGEEAVRLFADRAVLARPAFEVTAGNEEAVRRICRRLDGIPLAVELAAARVASLSVEQIERRLDDRFRLLTGGSRTALPRQQTLRALVDWSHDLLDPGEQSLFRRLSVFAGSFTAERAESVTGADAADGIHDLVRKSLLVMEEVGGAARYRFLETIREYAVDKLAAAGETESTADVHLHVTAGFAEEAATHVLGPDQRLWLDRLDDEWPDVERALERALAVDPSTAVSVAGALGPFFAIRGHVPAGRALLERALDAEPAGPVDRVRIRALAAAGTLARTMCDFAAARRHHEAQLDAVRDDPDEELAAKALSSLGNVALLEGDLAEARRLCEESLEIRRRLGAPRPLALALNNLGVLADCEGDFAAAEAAYLEHLELMRGLGDGRVVGQTLTNLALVRLATGDHEAAARDIEESLRLLREVGDGRSVAVTTAVEAGLHRDQDDPAGALARYGEALRALDELADAVGVGMCLDGIATVLARRDDHDDRRLAARLLGAASALPIGVAERGRGEEDAVAATAAALRVALGDAAYDEAFAAGRDGDTSAAVAAALGAAGSTPD